MGNAVGPCRCVGAMPVNPVEQVPAWLVAYHAGQGHHEPVQPKARPSLVRRARTARNSPIVSQGFLEPAVWAWDGGVRREPVLDIDHNPPRIVRRVGWHNCLRCRRPFFSDDVVAQRLCASCRGEGDRYVE